MQAGRGRNVSRSRWQGCDGGRQAGGCKRGRVRGGVGVGQGGDAGWVVEDEVFLAELCLVVRVDYVDGAGFVDAEEPAALRDV